MTATDELHGQLDTGYPHTLRPELHKAINARGIDYWVAQGITFWNRDDGCECLAYGYQADGVPKLAIKVVGFTDPEQAIAATVGRGTCEADMTEDELRITAANALAENEQLRELLQRALTSHDKMCTQRGNCFRCRFFDAKPFAPACPFVSVIRDARELGVEVLDGD